MMDNPAHTHIQVQAYHDGELSPTQAARVEAHLVSCAACREELAALQALSALLQAAPAATESLTEERFASQVALKLPQRPQRTATQQALFTAWRLAPALLVGIWLFLETASVLTRGITSLLALGIGADTLGALLPSAGTTDGWHAWLAQAVFRRLGDWAPGALPAVQSIGGALAQLGSIINIAHLILLLGTGLLLWSWLASWTASRRQPVVGG